MVQALTALLVASSGAAGSLPLSGSVMLCDTDIGGNAAWIGTASGNLVNQFEDKSSFTRSWCRSRPTTEAVVSLTLDTW
jgi:hypothetical protein